MGALDGPLLLVRRFNKSIDDNDNSSRILVGCDLPLLLEPFNSIESKLFDDEIRWSIVDKRFFVTDATALDDVLWFILELTELLFNIDGDCSKQANSLFRRSR